MRRTNRRSRQFRYERNGGRMIKRNEKGGAVLAAILVTLLIAAAGTTALFVTGQKAIADTKPAGTSQQVITDSSSSKSDSDSSSAEKPEEEKKVYPEKAEGYENISTKGLTCKSGILYDVDNNDIMAGLNYDKKIYPASLTKMLTLLVAVENIDSLDKTYTFKSKDIDPLIEDNASRAGFEAGEKVTMKDLLYSSILVSGADGTVGLANSVAGSEKAFVKLMNDKIKELGLTGTEFVNASGLHSKNHYSTAQDIALITKACLENTTCKKILTAGSYTTSKTKLHPKGIELTSIVISRINGYFIDTNGDNKADAKIVGGKTGFTDEAGYTLSTICKRGNHYYICVTTKSKSDLKAVEDQIAIYEKYLPKVK